MVLSPQELVEGAVRLSSPPDIFVRINEVVNDPYSSFRDVAHVISHDTSLSVRLLKIVNSSFYNFPTQIDSITHAVSIVGTHQLRELALATIVINNFQGIPEDLVSMNSFWRHSLACGIAARVIAIQKGEANSERYFLTGILHDVGRLVIFLNAPDEAREMIMRWQDNDELLYKVEHEALGFDHGMVGSSLMKSWQIPFRIEEIIECHHNPLMSSKFPLETSIIHLADTMVKALELGCSGDYYVPPLEPLAWETIGLSANELPVIWKQVESQYKQTAEFFLSV